MTFTRATTSAEQTERAGAEFAELLITGDVVLISGALGAGKTVFARGVGRGLGVAERVTSPTFVVVRQHVTHTSASIRTMHHADVYRTGDISEIIDLGLGELVEEDAVAIIEWGELAASVLGPRVMTLVISVTGENERLLALSGDLTTGREGALEQWSRS